MLCISCVSLSHLQLPKQLPLRHPRQPAPPRRLSFIAPCNMYVPIPNCYSGEVRHCGSFLLQCLFVFPLFPHLRRIGGTGWRGLLSCLWYGRITRTLPISRVRSGLTPSKHVGLFSCDVSASPRPTSPDPGTLYQMPCPASSTVRGDK